jgi:hypothetical protein
MARRGLGVQEKRPAGDPLRQLRPVILCGSSGRRWGITLHTTSRRRRAGPHESSSSVMLTQDLCSLDSLKRSVVLLCLKYLVSFTLFCYERMLDMLKYLMTVESHIFKLSKSTFYIIIFEPRPSNMDRLQT